MTETKPDVMSEAFGREVVAKTVFTKEAIWLPLLAIHHLNAGEGVIRGKTFRECVIEGPALIAPTTNVVFESCNLGIATDPKSLLFKPQGPILIGAIGFADCRFEHCRFVQVGFTGADEFLEGMANDLISARSLEA